MFESTFESVCTRDQFESLSESDQVRVVLQTLQDVSYEAGRDFEYRDQCSYVNDGKPSCIVGHVLYRLGWTEATMIGKWSDGHAGRTNGCTIDAISTVSRADNWTERIHRHALIVLTAAQRSQDVHPMYSESSYSWRVAVGRAESAAFALGYPVGAGVWSRRFTFDHIPDRPNE